MKKSWSRKWISYRCLLDGTTKFRFYCTNVGSTTKGEDTLFADSCIFRLAAKTQQVLKHVEGINDYEQFIGTVSEELQHEYKRRNLY